MSDDVHVRELAEDVIDSLRVLRCADALRQRGTVLRTSAGYQVFIDRDTANALYALEHGNGRGFLVEGDNVFSAGEANLASSELTVEGNVRFRVSPWFVSWPRSGETRSIQRGGSHQ